MQWRWQFLDTLLARGSVSQHELHSFTHAVRDDVNAVLAAAARIQLDACHQRVEEIRAILSPQEWHDVRVLILGPYMAKRGQLFLQYFSHLLNAPMTGDRRLVYFDGDDLGLAFERFGTTTLDGDAAQAIFGNRQRLHRDVLADATRQYLSAITPAPAPPPELRPNSPR